MVSYIEHPSSRLPVCIFLQFPQDGAPVAMWLVGLDTQPRPTAVSQPLEGVLDATGLMWTNI